MLSFSKGHLKQHTHTHTHTHTVQYNSSLVQRNKKPETSSPQKDNFLQTLSENEHSLTLRLVKSHTKTQNEKRRGQRHKVNCPAVYYSHTSGPLLSVCVGA